MRIYTTASLKKPRDERSRFYPYKKFKSPLSNGDFYNAYHVSAIVAQYESFISHCLPLKVGIVTGEAEGEI